MRKFNSFPLDDDIIDQILTSLPDFDTLLAAITTSKTIHNIYRLHPTSITHAVALNIAGPALPQALKLIRSEATNLDEENNPQEADVMNTPIKASETRILSQYAEAAHYLEDIYSSRRKDRSNKKSQLTALESLRFQRALYRLWIFTATFGADHHDGLFEEEPEEWEQLAEKHQPFLDKFETQDLKEIERVYAFLLEIAHWIHMVSLRHDLIDQTMISHFLAASPLLILESYQDKDIDIVMSEYNLDNDCWDRFLLEPLQQILQKRKTSIPDQGFTDKGIILSSVYGEDDECHRCHAVYGVRLWNEINWDHLEGILPPYSLRKFFKGNILRNLVERPVIDQALMATSFPDLLREMLNLRVPSFLDMTEQAWICQGCLESFFAEHMHLWWLDVKRKRGEAIQEDCWYGWNCRTQTHKQSHASKLNHFCKPTRGDGA